MKAILYSRAKHLGNIGRGYYEEHFCEIILNLDQRLRIGCHLRYFYFSSMTILFSEVERFVQF